VRIGDVLLPLVIDVAVPDGARHGSRPAQDRHRHAAAVWRSHQLEQGISIMADQLIHQLLIPIVYIVASCCH
jgi:hypothetical protein